jgi:hypothetical protein
MKMKKYLVFVLIFFLVFSFQFKLANSLSPGECRYYVDGICADEGYSIEGEVPLETSGTIETNVPSPEPAKFTTLIFQLIGIVVLFVVLIILVQEIIKSKSKKPRKK